MDASVYRRRDRLRDRAQIDAGCRRPGTHAGTVSAGADRAHRLVAMAPTIGIPLLVPRNLVDRPRILHCLVAWHSRGAVRGDRLERRTSLVWSLRRVWRAL